uniref:Cytochrome P450 n=1 Tax=Bionectria ochroleuca TaxID=29856 RepID=A0A8H7NBH0_BIOOC
MAGLSTIFLTLGVPALLVFFVKLSAARQLIWKLQRAGLPMPDVKLLTGHLLTIKTISESFPSNTVMHNVFWEISKQFPHGFFYIDLWPFARTTLVITTPSGAAQVEAFDLAVPDSIVHPIETITGGPSLLTMRIGPQWKRQRRALSSGFSASSMMALAPAVAEEVAAFRLLLLDRCSAGTSDVFQLEELTLRLTFDVIGVVTFGTKLHCQTTNNELARAMRRQIEWTTFTAMNPLQRYLSLRPLVHWINGRRIDKYIAVEIEKRFQECLNTQIDKDLDTQRYPSTISLLLDDMMQQDEGVKNLDTYKESLKKTMTAQLRAYLFGGHDTTSSTLLYCYYLLSAHPDVLEKVMAEHDSVFGDGTASREHDLICENPNRLNQLPYTLAVIKEVLRIFPPAASMREGRPGADVIDEQGRVYPTEGCNVWSLTLAIHHNPKYWADPEDFNPDRWLVGPEDPLHPVKGAWIPFQHGPKNCLGQPLAILELKICLVMTLREFCITPAYEEWDVRHPRRGNKTINGNRAYQAEKGGGGAHPADGLPVRVTLRKR